MLRDDVGLQVFSVHRIVVSRTDSVFLRNQVVTYKTTFIDPPDLILSLVGIHSRCIISDIAASRRFSGLRLKNEIQRKTTTQNFPIETDEPSSKKRFPIKLVARASEDSG